MNCNECGFWKSDMDPQTGAEIHRCACNASPQLDDETAAEDGCEYGVPPIEDVLRWLDHRLQGALMPGAERMYRAIRYYLGEATALSTLQAENEEMQKQLNEFSEFLCHMTGGLLSKTNYTAQEMISAAEDYQQKVCDNDCDLRADLEQERAHRIHAEQHADAFLKDCERLDADLARVTAERDAAISDMVFIARTYPVELCDDLVCKFCVHFPNAQTGCPGWEKNECFEWRGVKED